MITRRRNVQAAAQRVGIKIQLVEASHPQEIATAFAAIVRHNAEALIVPLERLFQQPKDQIAELATKQRLLSLGAYAEYAEAGGLMSYAPNVRENSRRPATNVDKILKGANPGNVPVEQPTQFELFIIGKTAKALGVKIPDSILLQATKVIE